MIFLAGAAVTVFLVVLRVVQLIYWNNTDRRQNAAMWAGAPALGLITLLVWILF